MADNNDVREREVTTPEAGDESRRRGGPRPVWVAALGIAALIGAVICALVLAGRLINGLPLDNNLSYALGAGSVLLLALAAGCYWEHLAATLGARGTLLQLNAGVAILLVLGIIVLLNHWVIPRRLGYVKADLTAEQFYSLSGQTVNVARNLTEENALEMIALIPGGDYSDPRATEVQNKRLQEYERLSPHLTVRTLDPLINPEGAKLAREGVISSLPGVIIRKKADPSQREGVTSLEEADLTRGILRLLDPSSRKLYFLTGHGEAALEATGADGLSQFRTLLTNDRYEAAELNLGTEAIPADAAGLVSVFPKSLYRPQELEKLRSYLAGGGRLAAFIDPDGDSSLGEVLSQYGIEFHDAVVHDSQNTWGNDPQYWGLIDYTEHETVEFQRLARVPILFMRSGYLTRSGQGNLEVTELAKSTATSYAQGDQPSEPSPTAPTDPDNPQAPPPAAERTEGPLTVMMVASTKAPAADEGEDEEAADDEAQQAEAKAEAESRIRVAVVADGEFPLNMWQNINPSNFEVAANLVAWMTDRTEVIGIRAKDPYQALQERQITVDQAAKRWIFIGTFVLPLLLIAGAGAVVYFVRRR